MSRSSCGYFTPAFFSCIHPGWQPSATPVRGRRVHPDGTWRAVTKHPYLTGLGTRAGWQVLSCSGYLQAFQSLLML